MKIRVFKSIMGIQDLIGRIDFKIHRVGSRYEMGLRNLFRVDRSIINLFPPSELGTVKTRETKREARTDMMITFFSMKSAIRASIAADDR